MSSRLLNDIKCGSVKHNSFPHPALPSHRVSLNQAPEDFVNLNVDEILMMEDKRHIVNETSFSSVLYD